MLPWHGRKSQCLRGVFCGRGVCFGQHAVKESLTIPQAATLSFELLRTFLAVVHGGGDAAKAMRDLGLNQPTMSKRLRHLQHPGPVLKKPWLVRRGKLWQLTAEGQRVLPAVAELVQGYANLSLFLRGEDVDATPIRFACGQQMAQGFVRKALRIYTAEHAGLPPRISTLRGHSRIEGVANGSLDMAIVTHDEAAIAEIARRPLHIESLVSQCLALVDAGTASWSRSFCQLPDQEVKPSHLCDFPLIMPEPDSGIRKAVDQVLRDEGVIGKLRVVLQVGGWPTILVYVQDGYGVGLVSDATLSEAPGLRIRYLHPSHFPPIVAKLICRRLSGAGDQLDLSPAAQVWRHVLLATGNPPAPG
jgi:DNA-binding transcriptional LysR family regulator